MAFLSTSPLAPKPRVNQTATRTKRGVPFASLRVAVVGAGTAGTALALALQRQNVHVSLFERAAAARAPPCGVLLRSQSLDALEACGLEDTVASIRAAGVEISTFALQALSDDAVIARSFPPPGPSGHRDLSVRRADVLDALMQPFLRAGGKLHTGVSVASVAQDGGSASLRFENRDGKDDYAWHGDVVVGADGVRSTVAAAVAADRRLNFLGDRVWRGITRTEGAFDGDAESTGGVLRSWKRECGVFGSAFAVDETHTHWGVFEDAGTSDAGAALEEDAACGPELTARRAVPERLLSVLPVSLRSLVDRTNARDVVYGLAFDNDPLESYVCGRVGLIGDAAHSMSSISGWGMGSGFQDAACLAGLLASGPDCETALRAFDTTRREDSQLTQLKARKMDQASRRRGA